MHHRKENEGAGTSMAEPAPTAASPSGWISLGDAAEASVYAAAIQRLRFVSVALASREEEPASALSGS